MNDMILRNATIIRNIFGMHYSNVDLISLLHMKAIAVSHIKR